MAGYFFDMIPLPSANRLLASNRLLGALVFALALSCLLLWIPRDIDTGWVETVRRRNVIGDSLAPAVAMILTAIAAVALMRHSHEDDRFQNQGKWHIIFGFFIVVFTLTLLLMRFAGPLLVYLANFMTGDDLTYRNLRNIRPLKYVGFVGGGTFMLCCLSHFMDRSLSYKRALLFLAISIVIALFFDLPFEDILLPPNGDV